MGAGKNAGFLLPFQTSTQQISTGRWSLSSRSNVPYVQLLGKGVNKTFTWGEVVEVPEGEICALRNASYHAGDVWLNNGWDFDNRPTSITVPVPYTRVSQINGDDYLSGEYPADVRMARSAYMMMDARPNNGVNPITAYVIGKALDGSHNTDSEIVASATVQGAGYVNIVSLPSSTEIGYIPLGHKLTPGVFVSPQVMLTVADVFVRDLLLTTFPNIMNTYYVMEY